MKKLCLLSLTALLLLSALPSCSRRGAYESMLESQQAAESDRLIPKPGADGVANIVGTDVDDYALPVIKKTSDKGFFEGKTKEELYALYQGNSVNDKSEYFLPTGRIIDAAGPGDCFFYNKLTGNISTWCPDPLCDHQWENCLFNSAWSLVGKTEFVTKDHLYFICSYNDDVDRLVRCDHERNNVERLYANGREISDIVCEKDGKLYFSEFKYAGSGESAYCVLMELDLSTKKATVANDEHDFNHIFMMGDTVIFSDRENIRKYYKTDLSFEKVEELFEYAQINSYTNRYITYIPIDPKDADLVVYHNVYDLETGKIIELGNIYNATISGDYIYYRERLSPEEIEKSPLKDFYTYTWDNEKIVITTGTGNRKAVHTYPASTGNKSGMDLRGRIMRMKLDGTERECVLEMTYEGIPVRIENFSVDGECIWFTFNNYKEFRNYYNQTWTNLGLLKNPNATVEGAETWADEFMHDGPHLAVADLQNGTVRIIEPDRSIWYKFD